MVSARREQLHYRIPPITPSRGVVSKLVGLGGESRRCGPGCVGFEQRDNRNVVLGELIEALLHVGALGDAIAANLGEVGL